MLDNIVCIKQHPHIFFPHVISSTRCLLEKRTQHIVTSADNNIHSVVTFLNKTFLLHSKEDQNQCGPVQFSLEVEVKYC